MLSVFNSPEGLRPKNVFKNYFRLIMCFWVSVQSAPTAFCYPLAAAVQLVREVCLRGEFFHQHGLWCSTKDDLCYQEADVAVHPDCTEFVFML